MKCSRQLFLVSIELSEKENMLLHKTTVKSYCNRKLYSLFKYNNFFVHLIISWKGKGKHG